MNHPLELSDAELALVAELLDREQQDLPAEIRHTRINGMREELRKRQALVQQLLARLHAEAAV